MLVDLNLKGKAVVVFGGGAVGERKAKKFLGAGSRVLVIGKKFTKGLKLLGEEGKIELMELDINPSSIASFISNSRVVVAATNDRELNRAIAEEARKRGILVSVVDDPSLNDFHMPAAARFGGIEVAVSTGGRSPAMAKLLRERLEEAITREDVLQVELQSYARALAKVRIPTSEARRAILYQIIQNPRIKRLLKEGDLEGAKTLVKQIVEGRGG